jgi:hypothetical protein
MPVCQQTQLFWGKLDVLANAIQHHEVVASAVHLGEFEQHYEISISLPCDSVAVLGSS